MSKFVLGIKTVNFWNRIILGNCVLRIVLSYSFVEGFNRVNFSAISSIIAAGKNFSFSCLLILDLMCSTASFFSAAITGFGATDFGFFCSDDVRFLGVFLIFETDFTLNQNC